MWPLSLEPPQAVNQRILLPASVNYHDESIVNVILQDHDILLKKSDLAILGLDFGERGTVVVDREEAYLSLNSLQDVLSYQFDEVGVKLTLIVSPQYLPSRTFTRLSNKPPDLEYKKATSLYFNYGINGQTDKTYLFYGETGLSLDGNPLYTNFSYASSTKQFVRNTTNYILDYPAKMLRITLGDSFAYNGILGGSSLLGGLSIAKQFTLDPYFIRVPGVNLTGAALTPASLEVYTNGILTRKEYIAPGMFSLNNLTVPIGLGNVQMVVRDIFGHEQIFNTPYYVSSSLLAKGIADYNINLGFRRLKFGQDNFNYGELLGFASYRYGLSNHLTLGLKSEANKDLFNAGSLVNVNLGVGELELAVMSSLHQLKRQSKTKLASSLAYAFTSKRLSLGFFTRIYQQDYLNNATIFNPDNKFLEYSVYTSLPVIASFTLAANYLTTLWHNQDRSHTLATNAGMRLWKSLNMFLSLERSTASRQAATFRAFLGLNYVLNNSVNSSLYYNQDTHKSASFQMQKTLPLKNGLGYLVNAQLGEQFELYKGMLQYQSQYGRYELVASKNNEDYLATMNINGGLVYIDKSLQFTRSLQDSFVLVKTPKGNEIDVYLENHLIGKTSKSGEFLVPNLLPYYGNKLAVSDTDLPINYLIKQKSLVIATPYRGGAVAKFAIEKLQALLGKIRCLESAQAGDLKAGKAPAFGELIIAKEKVTIDNYQDNLRDKASSPLGKDGEFYFENLTPGDYQALVMYEDHTCNFTLTVKETENFYLNLGTVPCILSVP